MPAALCQILDMRYAQKVGWLVNLHSVKILLLMTSSIDECFDFGLGTLSSPIGDKAIYQLVRIHHVAFWGILADGGLRSRLQNFRTLSVLNIRSV